MDFLKIDGSQGEGGGQILRTAVSLSCIFGVPISVRNIRAGRKEPGLRPQHLQAIRSAAEISGSTLSNADVGSTEIKFCPGKPSSRSLSKRIETGTAGSVTLIAQTLIPIGIFCGLDLDLEITGGTEVPASPSIDYLQKIVLPIYRRFGGDVKIDLKRRGYYPRGGGLVLVQVQGSKSKAMPLTFEAVRPSTISAAKILAASRLLPDHIARREVDAARILLSRSGVTSLETETDSSGESFSPGTSVLVYRQNESQFVGALSLGERGKKAEIVGTEAAQVFLGESRGSPNVDCHLADMIVTLASCISGKSSFTTSNITKHLETNLEVARIITGASFRIEEAPEKRVYEVEISGCAEKSN